MSEVMVATDAALLQKEVYKREKVMTDQFEEGTPLHDLIDSGTYVTDAVKSIGEWEGSFMTLMHRLSGNPNPAVGFKEGDEHARAGKNTYAKGRFVIAQMNQTFAISGLAQLKTRGGVSSVDDVLSLEADGQISAARKALSKIMHGDGTGLIDTAGTSNEWDNSAKTLHVPDASLFEVGQEIIPRAKITTGLSIGATGTAHTTTNGKIDPMLITVVNTSTNKLTVTMHNGEAFVNTNVDFADGLGLYPYDAQAKQMWGIGNVCGNANPGASGFDPADPTTILTTEALQIQGLFGGIDRAVAAGTYFEALVYTATALGGTTTPSASRHVKPLLNRIHKRTGGNHGWLLGLTGFDVWDALADELERDRRTSFKVTLKAGGHEAIVIGDLYIVVDQDAVYTTLKVFEPDSMFRVVPEPWHIDTTTGTWNRRRGALSRGMDEFDTYWMTSQQLLAARTLACGQITGFTANL